jgi:hypothetical protein
MPPPPQNPKRRQCNPPRSLSVAPTAAGCGNAKWLTYKEDNMIFTNSGRVTMANNKSGYGVPSLFILCCLISAWACDPTAKDQPVAETKLNPSAPYNIDYLKLDKVISVSASPFTIAGSQAVRIRFGGDEKNGAEVVVLRSQVEEGFFASLPTRNPEHPNLAVHAFKQNIPFQDASKLGTWAKFSINEIDWDNKLAEVTFSCKLWREKYNYIEIPEAVIQIKGRDFENFTRKHPIRKSGD